MRFGFRNRRFAGLACLLLLLEAVPSRAQTAVGEGKVPPGGNTLASVLADMDRAAAQFHSVAANLEYTKVTVIVDDHSTERGKIFFEKKNDKLRVMLAFEQPAEKYVLFSGGKVSIYRPKIGEVEEYSLANNQGLLEQFLLLGFGTSGTELQKSYTVVVKGEETLEGALAIHLELAPKDTNVAARLQRIELWLSPKSWQPVQQKFVEPSKDYLIARYRDVQENAKIDAKSFRFPVRGKVRTVKR